MFFRRQPALRGADLATWNALTARMAVIEHEENHQHGAGCDGHMCTGSTRSQLGYQAARDLGLRDQEYSRLASLHRADVDAR